MLSSERIRGRDHEFDAMMRANPVKTVRKSLDWSRAKALHSLSTIASRAIMPQRVSKALSVGFEPAPPADDVVKMLALLPPR